MSQEYEFIFLFSDLSHVWRGRSQDSLHVRQRDKLQPEIPSLRLELQCGLCILPRLVGHKIIVCRENHFHFVHSRYYLNDLTYRTDPPKSSTESYNVRRRKSWWSVKEPEVDEEVEAKEEKVEEAEFNIADLGYWQIYSWETLCLNRNSFELTVALKVICDQTLQ